MGAPDLALALNIDLALRLDDPGQLSALGEVAIENRDARGLLVVGKSAVQRGFPLDTHAYPTIGIPSFEPVGGRVDKAMVYAIARQESMFDPKAQSHAGARGLMQLMPATAKSMNEEGPGRPPARIVCEAMAFQSRTASARAGVSDITV